MYGNFAFRSPRFGVVNGLLRGGLGYGGGESGKPVRIANHNVGAGVVRDV